MRCFMVTSSIHSTNSLIADYGGHEDPQRRSSQGPSSRRHHLSRGPINDDIPSTLRLPGHSEERTKVCFAIVNKRSRTERVEGCPHSGMLSVPSCELRRPPGGAFVEA